MVDPGLSRPFSRSVGTGAPHRVQYHFVGRQAVGPIHVGVDLVLFGVVDQVVDHFSSITALPRAAALRALRLRSGAPLR